MARNFGDILIRHGHACRGHLRLGVKEDVDGRHRRSKNAVLPDGMTGHDEVELHSLSRDHGNSDAGKSAA